MSVNPAAYTPRFCPGCKTSHLTDALDHPGMVRCRSCGHVFTLRADHLGHDLTGGPAA